MPSYKVHVRGQVYLWGGSGISKELHSSLYLHLRVDEAGEGIVIGVREADGTMVRVGSLRA
jgi:hypothetical protein